MKNSREANPLARNCVDCAYHCKVYFLIMCDYLAKVGQVRPCPGGDACTVKVPYKRRSYPKREKVTE